MDVRMKKRQAFASDMKETTCVPSAARTQRRGVRSHHVRCFGFPTLFYAYKHRIKTACCIYQNGDISRNGGGEEFSPFSFIIQPALLPAARTTSKGCAASPCQQGTHFRPNNFALEEAVSRVGTSIFGRTRTLQGASSPLNWNSHRLSSGSCALIPCPPLSPGSFSSALSPRLAEMPPAAPPLAERTFPSERRVPLPGGSPLRDDWPPRRADLLLSPVLCARWSLGLSCGTILDTAPVRVRRALVRHSEPAPPNHFHLTPGTVSSLRRHAILSPLPVRDGGVVFSLADNGSLLVLAVRRAHSCSPRQSIDVEGRWVTEVTIITEEHFSRFPL